MIAITAEAHNGVLHQRPSITERLHKTPTLRSMMMDGPLPTAPEGNSVLVVMAHPDDAEFGCGGTIAKWAAAGKEINYVLCTSGDKGSSDATASPWQLAQTRRKEQINAA